MRIIADSEISSEIRMSKMLQQSLGIFKKIFVRQIVTAIYVLMFWTGLFQILPSVVVASISAPEQQSDNFGFDNFNTNLKCDQLKMGQYRCIDPKINNETQQPVGCREDGQGQYTVDVDCLPVKGIICDGKLHEGDTVGFRRRVRCKWTNGHKFSIAVLLSVFLGMFGVDRFYLGYPAIGLLKLCTLGFMFLGQLVDVMLIALQVVGPADGSNYVIDYYGPGLNQIYKDNMTYVKPQYDTGYGNYEL